MATTVEQDLSDIIAEAMGELEYLQANALSFQGAIRDKVAIERGQLQAIIDAIHSAVATQSHQELSSIRDSYRSVLTSIENNIQADIANVQSTAETAGAPPIDLSALIASQTAAQMAPSIATTPPLIPPASTQATQGIAATTTALSTQSGSTRPIKYVSRPWTGIGDCPLPGEFGVYTSYLAVYEDPSGVVDPLWPAPMKMKYFSDVPLWFSETAKLQFVLQYGIDAGSPNYLQFPRPGLYPSCELIPATAGGLTPAIPPPPPPPPPLPPPPPPPTIVDCCDQLKAIADSLATIVGYRVAYFEGNGGDYIKDKMAKFLAIPKEQVFNDKTLDDVTKDLLADADFAGFITKANP